MSGLSKEKQKKRFRDFFIQTNAKREAILFFSVSSEVNTPLLLTSKLANQNAWKAPFTCV